MEEKNADVISFSNTATPSYGKSAQMASERTTPNGGGLVAKRHDVEILNRKRISLSGVEKVKNINETLFVGKVAGYTITVQGQNMELTKLDLESGIVEITGTITALKYTGNADNQSLLKRIFK